MKEIKSKLANLQESMVKILVNANDDSELADWARPFIKQVAETCLPAQEVVILKDKVREGNYDFSLLLKSKLEELSQSFIQISDQVKTQTDELKAKFDSIEKLKPKKKRYVNVFAKLEKDSIETAGEIARMKDEPARINETKEWALQQIQDQVRKTQQALKWIEENPVPLINGQNFKPPHMTKDSLEQKVSSMKISSPKVEESFKKREKKESEKSVQKIKKQELLSQPIKSSEDFKFSYKLVRGFETADVEELDELEEETYENYELEIDQKGRLKPLDGGTIWPAKPDYNDPIQWIDAREDPGCMDTNDPLFNFKLKSGKFSDLKAIDYKQDCYDSEEDSQEDVEMTRTEINPDKIRKVRTTIFDDELKGISFFDCEDEYLEEIGMIADSYDFWAFKLAENERIVGFQSKLKDSRAYHRDFFFIVATKHLL